MFRKAAKRIKKMMSHKAAKRIKKQMFVTFEFAVPTLAGCLHPGLSFVVGAAIFAYHFLKEEK